jgi:hypothetical protein
MEVPKSVYTSSKNWLLKKIQRFQKGLGSKLVPVKHYEASACTHAFTNAAFLKLWSADLKWSSGSALVVLLD